MADLTHTVPLPSRSARNVHATHGLAKLSDRQLDHIHASVIDGLSHGRSTDVQASADLLAAIAYEQGLRALPVQS